MKFLNQTITIRAGMAIIVTLLVAAVLAEILSDYIKHRTIRRDK